ncbi:MAG: YlbF family regulator [Oscillospiraceae bacterium]
MDKIERMARDLGKAIQEDERYISYNILKDKADNDEVLQQLIQEFNLARVQLNTEMSKEDKDGDRLQELDQKIKDTYSKIISNENMSAYNEAQDKMNALLSAVNLIITASANGEDPETCSAVQSCSGICSTCGGCS